MSILVALLRFVLSNEIYLQIRKNGEYVLFNGIEQVDDFIDRNNDLEPELCEPGDSFEMDVTPK